MNLAIQESLLKKQRSDIGQPTPPTDYKYMLSQYTTNIHEDEHYLYVGEQKLSQGWLLHITVIPFQIREIMKAIIPTLLHYKMPFKVIRNQELHEEINAGMHGMFKVGKVFTIFLEKEAAIEPLTRELIEKVAPFQGPAVTTDFFIANNLFARYGTFIPQIEIDPFGNHVRVIKDPLGNTYEDRYLLPPSIPPGVSNPFINVAARPPKEKKHFQIAGKYFITAEIKSDVKGNVYKGFYISKNLLPKWCIIKEGRKGIYPDATGRDVRNRLDWQQTIIEKFADLIQTPKVLDCIHQGDVSYLVTAYIPRSQNLNHYIVKKVLHKPWFSQPQVLRKEILGYLLQIIQIIKIIHKNDYIHRDITDNNFLVASNKKIHAIDLELAYSVKDNKPDPPFGVGTPGYMSPEQERSEHPCFKHDIYSLGALMTMIFSGGIEPAYLIDRNQPGLFERLQLLTNEEQLAKLTALCVDDNSSARPSLLYVEDEIKRAMKKLSPDAPTRFAPARPDQLSETITKGINSLAGALMTYDGLWFSKTENEYGWEAYPLGNRHFYSNLHQGSAGVIYALTRLKKAGYDISSAEENMNIALEFVLKDIQNRLDSMAPSLYYGKAGLAMMISKLLSSKMLPFDPGYVNVVQELLKTPATSSEIMYGIAGQGLAALQCRETIDPQFAQYLLDQYANILIERQQPNGAWHKGTNAGKPEIVTGFGYGMAGIIYFLLKCGAERSNSNILASAEKGLNYLISSMKKKKTHVEWSINNQSKDVGNWWCTGAPGMALTFLKFYELTKSKQHLEIAEKALRQHPADFVYYKLGQCHGLAGLGELYLEAFKLTNNSEWIERADWIATQLYHFRKQPSSEEVHWLVESHVLPTASVMTGNSGILHFLARYLNQTKLSFPVIE